MKGLRLKFILAAMGSLFLVLAAIVVGMNVLSYMDIVDASDVAIMMISENGGTFPKPAMTVSGSGVDFPMPDMKGTPPPRPTGDMDLGQFPDSDSKQGEDFQFGPSFFRRNGMSEEAPYETRYFTVFLKDGVVSDTHMDNIAAVSEDEALLYAEEIIRDGDESGFINNQYRYRVDNDMIIFLDCSRRLESFDRTLLISSGVSLAGLFVVFLLVVFASKLVFRPVEESEKKQKQFLTDASHELKTPLAIIEANTEVIEIENGESKWTKSTRHQIHRLTDLVEQLIALTRLGETEASGNRETVEFSEILSETIEGYEASTEIEGKEIVSDITSGIQIHANEKNIRSLLGLLFDNAIKYSVPDTAIEVSLKIKSKKAILKVYNKTNDIKQGDNDILFERFYRTDASRNSETGGSGIGLSVAQSIVESYSGKIHAYSDDGKSLRITVSFPL